MIYIQNKTIPWHSGMTVRDLLDALADEYPYSVVRVDDRLVTSPNFESTTLADECHVFLIPMVAGG
ncbi:MAG: MoaD/ThiS family protein [Deltaproteobacteria bacterium]|nr:MoaD/ThiS family protein [Deltaproteobacteria bacterium]